MKLELVTGLMYVLHYTEDYQNISFTVAVHFEKSHHTWLVYLGQECQ
jgi:hypothetical protein